MAFRCLRRGRVRYLGDRHAAPRPRPVRPRPRTPPAASASRASRPPRSPAHRPRSATSQSARQERFPARRAQAAGWPRRLGTPPDTPGPGPPLPLIRIVRHGMRRPHETHEGEKPPRTKQGRRGHPPSVLTAAAPQPHCRQCRVPTVQPDDDVSPPSSAAPRLPSPPFVHRPSRTVMIDSPPSRQARPTHPRLTTISARTIHRFAEWLERPASEDRLDRQPKVLA